MYMVCVSMKPMSNHKSSVPVACLSARLMLASGLKNSSLQNQSSAA